LHAQQLVVRLWGLPASAFMAYRIKSNQTHKTARASFRGPPRPWVVGLLFVCCFLFVVWVWLLAVAVAAAVAVTSQIDLSAIRF
jgi:hypothetical protein